MTYDATTQIYADSCEASTLGWRPGEVPETFYHENILWAKYEDLHDPVGECTGWVYAPVDENLPALLTVLND